MKSNLPTLKTGPKPAGRLLRPLFTASLCAWMLLLLTSAVWGVTIPATPDLSCIKQRYGNTNCTANDFTAVATFSAAPGTPPFCVAGQSFEFEVDMDLQSNSPNRYDVGFFFGQNGNDPTSSSAADKCSVATFPTTLLPAAPWVDLDSNTCADFQGYGSDVTRINKIKVLCQGSSTGSLQIPYTLVYSQNSWAGSCSGPADVIPGSPSKCQGSAATVTGGVDVYTGAYVDVTKQTSPDGDGQAFSYTAAGPAGSKVIALVNGIYTPADAASATNTVTVSLADGQTARFFINAIAADQTLTVTEAATTNWESTAAISCAAVTGSPVLTTNNSTRTLSATLNTTALAAACTVTNTKRSKITLVKSVGVRVDTADQFSVSASGGGTLTGTTSATTSGSGTSASTTFYSTPGTALTLADAKASGPTALTSYDTRLTCTNAFSGPGATPNASLPSNLITASTTITPAPGDDITCTYTNTKKVYVTLQKTWVNAIVNDAVNVTATGLTTLNSVANTANETDAGAVQSARPGDVITLAEAYTTGNASNYTSTLSCSGNTTPLAGNVLTINGADSAITCRYTNTRKILTLQKTWVNAIVNDAVNVTASGLTTLNSVANTASETDAGSAQTVHAGDVITIGETFTSGTAANYTQTVACTGTTGLAGNVLTVGAGDTDIVCTQTNTRKTATVTLRKTWANAIVNDAVNVTATGLTTLNSVANTASETDAGSAQSVFVGTSLTLGETFTTGTAANYTQAVACTGTSGLAGNVLTVGSGDTAIVCTYTNTRKTANLTLRKTWVNAIINNAVNVTATGLTTLNSVANTAGETDSGGIQTVRAGDVITIGETFTSGTAVNYTQALACTGTTGLAGNVLTVGSGDTAIVCTYTNTRKTANLTLRKTWVNAVVNNAVNVTATGLTTLNSVANTASETDAGGVQTVRAGDVITIGETFTVGTAASYTQSVACTGTSGLAGNVLTVGSGDTAIVCTYTNTRKTATVTLQKTWVNAMVNDAVNVTATGLTTLNSVANTANETDAGAPQSVYVGTSLTLGETFTVGTAANYTQTLACTGTTGLAGNVLTVGSGDTAIFCTYTNTRKMSNLTLQKTWVNAIGNDAVNVTATGLTTLNSVANTANETDAGGVQTVRAGDVITLGESFTVGTAANYTQALACTGTAGLSGNVLTVGSGDTVIVCTYTNTRKTATVTLQKTWVNATVNDAVNVTATGLTTLNSVANTASETDAGGVQTVRSGDVITIGETFTSGTAANYTQALACTGTSGLAGNVLTVGFGDTAIVCTYTNTRKTATVTLQKTWVNATVNDAVNVTATGLTPLSSVANTASETDAGSAQSVFVGTVLTLGETFTVGTAANYSQALACTGTSGLTGNTLTVGSGDTSIVCTMTNTSNGVAVSGMVYNDADHDGFLDGGEGGTGQTPLNVKLVSRISGTCGSSASIAAAADPATGAFTIPNVTAGDYCLVISTNGTLTDANPTWPGGWIPTETPTGIRTVTVAASPVTGQSFGMYHGSKVSGKVFGDTGVGGGTPNDSVQNGSESGLAGVSVRVTDSSGGTVYDSAGTNGSGDYTLWISAAAGNSTLKVVETNPVGYLSTGGSGGAYDRAADATTFTNSVGTIYSGFNFGDVPVNTFISSNSRSVVAGGVVFYPHTFTAGTGGTVTFTTSAVASPSISGWSEVLYQDGNCNGSIDTGEPQITGPLTTTAGQQVCIIVKEFSPANAPTNATDTVTTTASFAYVNSTLPAGTLSVTDLTTVMQSGLTLLKYVDKASALPGDTLTYTITYVNTGLSQLNTIVISDNVPAFTNLVDPANTICCVNPSADCLGTPPTPYPASITGCTIANTATSINWTLSGILAPGASGQVKFSVRIQN